MFDLKKFKTGKYYVHLPTHELYVKVMEWLDDEGFVWNVGTKLYERDAWYNFAKETCICHVGDGNLNAGYFNLYDQVYNKLPLNVEYETTLEKFEVHIGDRFWNSLYARPETVTDIYYLQGKRKYRIEFEEEGTDCIEQVTFKHFTKEHIVPITDEFDNIDTSKTYSHEEVKNKLLPNLQKNEEHYTKVMDFNKEVYLDKNLKYGDAFTDTIKKYGYISALTRMHDKFNRIEQFILMGYEDNAEGLKDSLLDFANYAYMTVIELERDEQEALNQVEGEL